MQKLYPILLKQHIGRINKPIVKQEDRVDKGTLVAIPEGMGANIHASVSGIIKSIDENEIIIEADEVQKDEFKPLESSNNILDLIQAAGIVGMGGAGFPTHIKMDVDLNGGVVIANAVECEPLLAHNINQIINEPELIYKGLCYAMKAVNASKGIFAIKSKNVEAISSLKNVIKDTNIEIVKLPDMYPMGEERAIIREVLGKLLDPSQLPLEANAVVSNVETLAKIAEAVELKKPVISKNITVVGKLKNGLESQVFINVPIGTTVRELIEAAGGIDGEYGEIIIGGPFTGHSAKIDEPITKTSGGIIVTMPFLKETRNMGLLVCACGGNENRLREIAANMGAKVVGVERCKQAVEIKGSLKCENPGNCPGQAEKILKLKKSGAEVVLISNCSDCTNTVMCVAPKLKMPVYHLTDHVMRTVNHPLIRRLK
ncbi:proline reductase-associated electron transfer protein PrdC [Clostridium botulinum]|uniref:Proline reductase-associated electron transfer protein PrdC n=1 Tax=Clostridium botulinum TaxID=1491 RepID=A0A846JDS7_CLOBO|nr:proline reductase-associated electron transfer protein PrdC [Clostridium botulinum]ACA56655.1 respiratory-chain NADH dehydrogenase family protein [Clostridium botulinum A3 str. Loch Maree]NFH65922.1 proline reductase-associated electron transfer protein PrdC [Clostridium botulinum]NFJ10217.1 proline reductase-associated electron transfer protein PrdC [Clostridium botulinum]NFK16421.1 proline reductase-associated electron transfer protein PrdC [Clostridium botulinum]NFM94015.1 proline reduct